VAASQHIAILDDEVDITSLLANYFGAQGYRVTPVHTGSALLDVMRSDPPVLVLLDLGLPGEDGFAIARQLRERWNCGLVIVTGRGDSVDKVVGLEVGADDYVTKPFDLRELLARCKAVLRRTASKERPVIAPVAPAADRLALGTRLAFDSWKLDTAARTLVGTGGVVELTTGEFDLLLTFVRPRPRPLTRLPSRADQRTRGWPLRPHHRRPGGTAAQEARSRPRETTNHQIGPRSRLHPRAAGQAKLEVLHA
jgi:two-component system OmpR family response regulator